MSILPIHLKKISMADCAMIVLLAVGILARGWMLGSVPGGINQDEAFAGYEAYSLLHYGVDSSGYAFPVYLNTWGSGMNALNTYLMIPFVAVFGLHTWVIRIPQFLVACFTLYVVYKLLLGLFNKQAALTGLLVLAVCPWHIMMSRWALDSNLAPGFLLFGFYFFVLAAEHPKYYIPSALFYGFSLYCYATIWPIVPLVVVFQLLYLLYTKKLRFSRYAVAAVLLLALLALPLILFLLINYGYMEEIRTPFLSIPELTVMRESEISFHSKRQNFQGLLRMLWEQNDSFYWNATEEFGLYYSKWMLVFGVIGFLHCCKNALRSVLGRTYDGTVLLLVPFLCAVFLGCLISVNVNRINCLHLPILLFIAIGLHLVVQFLVRLLKKYGRVVPLVFVGVMLISFLRFENFYFTAYRENIGIMFHEGLEDAVHYAMTLAGDGQEVFVDSGFSYAKIMFYGRIPVTEYLDTVQYTDYPSAFLDLYSCGDFLFDVSGAVPGQICIIPPESVETFLAGGWQVERFGHAAVAY